MKRLILAALAITTFSSAAFAHEGHDHGNSAFENKTDIATEFELTETQIKNLDIKTVHAKEYDFFETIKAPMILDTSHGATPSAHGFIYEGADILKVRKGQKITFKLDAMPNKTFEGKITSVDDMIDPQTRLYSIYANITEKLSRNSHGLKGEMAIHTTPIETATGAPIEALQGEFGNYFVFIKHGNHFEKREVIVGYKTGSIVELMGVKAGEEVVTQGSYQLRYTSGKPITEEHEHKEIKDTHNHDDHDPNHQHDDNHDHFSHHGHQH